MPRNRAYRRHHALRMKARAQRSLMAQGRSDGREYAKKNANHLAMCSCWMCGNPRKHFKELTPQERAHAVSHREMQELMFVDEIEPVGTPEALAYLEKLRGE